MNNPVRFTEKLQWYKLYYRNPLMTLCADKYKVREYIKSKKLDGILNHLIGVFENFDEIDFTSLPHRFVMKTTNGSGTNIICKDKSKFDIKDAKSKIETWLKRNNYASGREWCYKNIKPQIIIEEFLEDSMSSFEGLNDYKFFCFNGRIEYIAVDVNREIAHRRNLYNINWNYIKVYGNDACSFGDCLEKPKKIDEMLRVARKLSKDFPFARVDLYLVKNKIIFGELTFYPWTGYVSFTPDEFDFDLGEKLALPVKY
ncbi:MAG: carbonic anhydrase [Candidatus Marinimicrobia bacterium]|nr:carbonic anhydrase [Candidatus Neomarinimicrobiota bacterium]MBL7023124.1 carbonic anhydrase [Candidatus Neomarinimicrobiota bacterium]